MRPLKFSNIIETAELVQRQKIDDAIAVRWLLEGRGVRLWLFGIFFLRPRQMT